MKDQSDDPSHYELTLLSQNSIMLPFTQELRVKHLR